MLAFMLITELKTTPLTLPINTIELSITRVRY